mmetsp:Transcript_12857/g.21425  ORF Transcript_12857/g.21425 Transcript_12857/m.21425 type:complete len:464 (+) Transcript_12857:146-1537(+)
MVACECPSTTQHVVAIERRRRRRRYDGVFLLILNSLIIFAMISPKNNPIQEILLQRRFLIAQQHDHQHRQQLFEHLVNSFHLNKPCNWNTKMQGGNRQAGGKRLSLIPFGGGGGGGGGDMQAGGPLRFDPNRNAYVPSEQKITQPRGLGNKFSDYWWDQTKTDVNLYIPISDPDMKAKDIELVLRPNQVIIKAKGKILFNETLAYPVKTYDPSWAFELDDIGRRIFELQLEKENTYLIWDEFKLGETVAHDLTITDVAFFEFEVRKKFVRIVKDADEIQADDNNETKNKTSSRLVHVRRRKKIGTVIFGLFGNVEGTLVDYFKDLIRGDMHHSILAEKEEVPLVRKIGYNDSVIHRIEPARYLLGGALLSVSDNLGVPLIPPQFEGSISMKGPGQIGIVQQMPGESGGYHDTRFIISTGVNGVNDTKVKSTQIGRVLQGNYDQLLYIYICNNSSSQNQREQSN